MGRVVQLGSVTEKLLRGRPGHFCLDINDSVGVLKNCIQACLPDGTTTIWLPSYNEIAEWLMDSKGKGLLLMGPVGTGKTLIATRVLPALLHDVYDKILYVFSATELGDETTEKEAKKAWFKVIDDVGTETYVSNYGSGKRWVFPEIVSDTSEKGKFLVVTTNLFPDDIKKRYGERVWDRLSVICKTVIVSGEKSLRKNVTL